MSRYVNDIQTSRSSDEVLRVTNDYLASEGFEKVDYEGEKVWKKGHGLALGPQFIKVVPDQGKVHIEAWIKMALLPGVYISEMGTGGFVGGVPKRRLKKRVATIVQALS